MREKTQSDATQLRFLKSVFHTTKSLLILNTAIFNRVGIPAREMYAEENGFSEKNIYIRIIFSERLFRKA